MINRKTVLVLGAGASKPYGLPLGWELRESILEIPATDLANVPSARRSAQYDGKASEFLASFRRSQYYSIDAFLGRRPEFERIGKHAIASTLLPRESTRQLLDLDPEDNWYRYLLQAMEADWDCLLENKVSFITFNYDRSLELMLVEAFKHRFGKSEAEALAVVKKFTIVHVYGKLGSIDPTADDFVPYGGGEDPSSYMFQAAKGLRVIPEGRDDSEEFIEARRLLKEAEALCFLGFGFDTQNIDRLGGFGISAGRRRSTSGEYFGYKVIPFAAAAFGMTRPECLAAASRISEAPKRLSQACLS